MMRNRKKIIFSTLALMIVAGALWFFVGSSVVHAAIDTGLNYAAGTGLAAQDPRATVANIIRIILGFLGVIAVGIIMYAGFIWMTAKGEEEKIQTAKKIMISAVIGLVIIMAAFGIASFVLGRLTDSTGGNPAGSCSPACSQGQYCCNSACQNTPCSNIGGGSDVFLVTGSTPAHQAVNVIRNTVVRYHFNLGVRSNSVTDSSFTVTAGGSAIAGQKTVNGNYIEFIPSAACDAPNQTLKCFAKNTLVTVEAKNGGSGIISVNGKELTCGGSSRCLLNFTTGEIVDTESPRVNITSQQVCAGSDNTLKASSTDNYGVSKIDFFVANNPIGSSINNSNPFVGSPYNATLPWTASGNAGDQITIKATAYDLDSNYASAEKNIRLSATHCCNGVKDENEKGIDCGGDCLACVGQACGAVGSPNQCVDDNCQSGFCTASGSQAACLCQARPVIDWVSPAGGFCVSGVNANKFCRKSTEATDCPASSCDLGTPNGSAGNFVTIGGSGFGTTRGKVFFSNIQAVLADDTNLGNPDCNKTAWKDNQIIAIVPAGAADGNISIETSSGAKDATDDDYGALINNFKKNNIDRPGVCSATPNSGVMDDEVQYKGIKLTAAEAFYGNLTLNVKAVGDPFSSAKEGKAKVPNITSGTTTTYVLKSDVESNFLPFVKENEPYSGPIISSVEPLTGPIGQYITIRGSGFGSSHSTSKIYFGAAASGIEADYAFPNICADSIWNDKQIIVKIPKNIASNSSYKLTLVRTGYSAVDSGDKQVAVTTGTPNPGVCRLQPALGQANSEVMLWGEYFGSKDSNSLVRFYNNQNKQGSAITFWDIDQTASGIKPWKVITTVPQLAATGPVRLVIDVAPNQKLSNAYNFIVGQCKKDADCGSEEGATCCAVGLPEAGKCKASAGECYGSVATSVYQWRFSTGSDSTCAHDQERCGTTCCAIGKCEDAATSKCRDCAQGMHQCGNGDCCNDVCKEPVGGGQSYCGDPSSCSGYAFNQCNDIYRCPNSPGFCSPYKGVGGVTETGDCNDNVCATKAGCSSGLAGNSCHYDKPLNRCVKNSTDLCRKGDMKKTGGGLIIDGAGKNVTGECKVYTGNVPRWRINWPQSCPTGWSKGVDSQYCFDAGSINGACTIAVAPFSCEGTPTEGKIALAENICKDGAVCNVNNKCEKTDAGSCDCCCTVANAQQDCCNGLTCEGKCGSGKPTQGICSGCAPGGIPNDDLCNCSHTSGKYCDPTGGVPGGAVGVCRDCGAITDPAECSRHEQCCVNGKDNNKCTSVVETPGRFEEGGLQYCAYYNCTNTAPENKCNPLKTKDGVYNKLEICNQSCPSTEISCKRQSGQLTCAGATCPANMHCDESNCTCKTNDTGVGQPCKDPLTAACTGKCTRGYQCLLPTAYNGNGAPAQGGDSSGQDTCRCCCKPVSKPGDVDSCKLINSSLNCEPDKAPCTSPAKERGLCCGCSKDSQCGDVTTTGCSTTDHCCRTRPVVNERYPLPNATNVCRNTVIDATFNQKMDPTSFSDNVILIGDYKSDPCPFGYGTPALAPRPEGRFASAIFSIKKFIVKLFPQLISTPAFAGTGNYCYVKGSVISYDISPTKSKVSFKFTNPLDINIKYYVIVKGDPDLSLFTDKDYFNTKINSIYKVGLVGSLALPAPEFNHTSFSNADIWSFTTGNDICKVDKVTVTPTFQLFQRSGQVGTTMEAFALDNKNNKIQTIPNIYDWDWDWSSDNTDIASVKKEPTPTLATPTAGNKQDAQTLARAKATITKDTVPPSTLGQSHEGTAVLRVFMCENPWPVYDPLSPPGYVWPWKDNTGGIEFYYCRDKNGSGTVDDLPALTDLPIVKEGGRKICMFGANALKTCTTDANCNNLAGSCLSEVLKEFFFFRENEPGIPFIEGALAPEGKSVTISWSPTPNTAKYKIYYGLGSGQYNTTIEVPFSSGKITKKIDGLVNGLNYFFTVTALSDKNQESIFSNEKILKPADITPPAIPNLQVSGGNNKISLFWNKVPDAVKYIAYFGTQHREEGSSYPVSTVVIKEPVSNVPNVVFPLGGGDLNGNETYYVSVRSVDEYGNISNYAPEVAKKPNQPYLLPLLDGGAINTGDTVDVSWLPFINALGYNIYYGNQPGSTSNKVTVSSNVYKRTIQGLADGTYYFSIKAITKNNPLQESDSSNERSIVINVGGGT